MCRLYVSGLIGPGARKTIQPMAKQLVLADYDQLHHSLLPSGMQRRWKQTCWL